MSKNKTIKDFGGKFTVCKTNEYGSIYLEDIYMTRVIYNDPATIVFWNDGTKTVSKCKSPDTYNKEMGLVMCYLKRLVGNDEVNKVLSNWNVGLNVMDISDVRWFIRNGYDHVETDENNGTGIYHVAATTD